MVSESSFMSKDEMLRISEKITNLILCFMFNRLAALRIWYFGYVDGFVSFDDFMNPSEFLLGEANVFIRNQIESEQHKLLVHFSSKQLSFVQNLIEPVWFRHNWQALCLEVSCHLSWSATYWTITTVPCRTKGLCALWEGSGAVCRP